MTLGPVVIGAGVAGCAASLRLAELGHRVTLIEGAEHIGGRARTLRAGDFSAETGGDTLLSSYSRTRRLIKQLDQADSLRSFDHTSGLHDGQRLHVVRAGSPLNYAGTSLLSIQDKIKLGTGYLRASLTPHANLFDEVEVARLRQDQSMADWARAHLGEKALEYLVRPAFESRWYFSCDEIPASFGLELLRRAPLTRYFCFAEGMSRLLKRMIRYAELITATTVDGVEPGPHGVHVRTGTDVLDAEGAIIATDAHAAARLLPPSFPQRQALAKARYSRNVRVLVGYQRDAWADHHPASINPVIESHYPIATVSLVSRKSYRLVPRGRQIVAVHLTDEASGRLADSEAIATAQEAIERFLPPSGQDPLFVRSIRWDRALPIPRPNQLRDLVAARDSLPARIALAGDYFALATIESAVRSGQRAADRLHVTLR